MSFELAGINADEPDGMMMIPLRAKPAAAAYYRAIERFLLKARAYRPRPIIARILRDYASGGLCRSWAARAMGASYYCVGRGANGRAFTAMPRHAPHGAHRASD